METVSWAALGASAVAMAGQVFQAWNGRLAARDKLQFDAKLVELDGKVRECESDRAALRTELNELRIPVKPPAEPPKG